MQTYWVVGKEGYTKKLPDFNKLSANDSPTPKHIFSSGTRKVSTGNENKDSSGYDSSNSIIPTETVKVSVGHTDGLVPSSNLEASPLGRKTLPPISKVES